MSGPVRLRPVREEDLEPMARFSLEPEALGEFEWTGFTDPRARRRRWEEDGLLGDDSSVLAVVLADDAFIGIVKLAQCFSRRDPRRTAAALTRPPPGDRDRPAARAQRARLRNGRAEAPGRLPLRDDPGPPDPSRHRGRQPGRAAGPREGGGSAARASCAASATEQGAGWTVSCTPCCATTPDRPESPPAEMTFVAWLLTAA